MSIVHWQPLRDFDTIRQQINHLFDELMHTSGNEGLIPKVNMSLNPAIELTETDTDIILKAELPGMEAKDLDVEVSKDAVAIAGEYRREQHAQDKDFIRSEFRYGQFHRIIPLPISVKNDQVKAEFKNGILMLIIPKVESTTRNVVKVDLTVQETAREAMTKERQHQEHLQDTMHNRTAAEVGMHTSN